MSTIADLYAYEAGQLPLSVDRKSALPETDIKEVSNYVQAMEYGLDRLHTLPVSLRLIRELHERLMEGVRGEQPTPGEFRRSQNWIGAPGCTLKEAEFVPPSVSEMHEALDALEKYLYESDIYPKGVAEQARDAWDRAKRLQDLRGQWRERLLKVRASALLLRLADSLFTSPVLSIPQAQGLLKVTYRSAQKNVEKLIELGILRQIGEPSYGKLYSASDILEIAG